MVFLTNGLTDGEEDLEAEIEVSNDYVTIDHIPSHEAYQWMVDFVHEVVAPADELAAEKLAIALDGKGAFHRFRNALPHMDDRWLHAWYQWREKHLQATAEAWLSSILSEHHQST